MLRQLILTLKVKPDLHTHTHTLASLCPLSFRAPGRAAEELGTATSMCVILYRRFVLIACQFTHPPFQTACPVKVHTDSAYHKTRSVHLARNAPNTAHAYIHTPLHFLPLRCLTYCRHDVGHTCFPFYLA